MPPMHPGMFCLKHYGPSLVQGRFFSPLARHSLDLEPKEESRQFSLPRKFEAKMVC